MILTPDLFDANPETAGTCSLQFQDFGALRRFFGPVRTVRCRNDNQLLRTLLQEPGRGAVLVVDGGGSTEVALMGDMLAARAVSNGWSGCVINGAVRDVADLATIELGIKAIGVNPAKSGKSGEGAVDVAVTIGGLTIAPGGWLYCDENGVLFAPSRLDDA